LEDGEPKTKKPACAKRVGGWGEKTSLSYDSGAQKTKKSKQSGREPEKNRSREGVCALRVNAELDHTGIGQEKSHASHEKKVPIRES